jgi:hypothetical protein
MAGAIGAWDSERLAIVSASSYSSSGDGIASSFGGEKIDPTAG